jgi:hypothetical protein
LDKLPVDLLVHEIIPHLGKLPSRSDDTDYWDRLIRTWIDGRDSCRIEELKEYVPLRFYGRNYNCHSRVECNPVSVFICFSPHLEIMPFDVYHRMQSACNQSYLDYSLDRRIKELVYQVRTGVKTVDDLNLEHVSTYGLEDSGGEDSGSEIGIDDSDDSEDDNDSEYAFSQSESESESESDSEMEM